MYIYINGTNSWNKHPISQFDPLYKDCTDGLNSFKITHQDTMGISSPKWDLEKTY